MFWAAYCMISRPVAVSPVKAILAIRLFVASALPISAPGPLTTLITPGGTMSSMSSISLRIDHGVGLAGLINRAVAGRKCRSDLPGRHQQREVERDDLADDTEWLVEVVGDRVLVDLRDRSLLAADHRRRSSGSDRPRAGCPRPASRGPACRCPSSRRRRAARGAPRSRPRPDSERASARSSTSRPTPSFATCAASSASSMSSAVDRATSVNGCPVAGVRFSAYSRSTGATQWPPMKLS